MKLSSRSRYGIRALIELAMQYGKGPVPVRKISKEGAISNKYLEQILNRLRGSKIIKTFRGPNGGYILATPPRNIKLDEVISLLEGPDEPVNCNKHKQFTKECNSCAVGAIFTSILNKRDQLLASLTLQDLLDMAQGTKKDLP